MIVSVACLFAEFALTISSTRLCKYRFNLVVEFGSVSLLFLRFLADDEDEAGEEEEEEEEEAASFDDGGSTTLRST